MRAASWLCQPRQVRRWVRKMSCFRCVLEKQGCVLTCLAQSNVGVHCKTGIHICKILSQPLAVLPGVCPRLDAGLTWWGFDPDYGDRV